jgi:hypothetical protein
MLRPKSKMKVFPDGMTLTAGRASWAMTGGELWAASTPLGAVAAAAAGHAESSNVPVFHPSGNIRAS